MNVTASLARHRAATVSCAAVALLLSGRPAHGQRSAIRYADVPDGAYAVVAEVRAKAGKADELRRITLPLIDKVRSEPNNLVYFVQEDRDAPGHFVFYEIFVGKDDFDAHNATLHVQAWFARLPELAEGGVKVIRMRTWGARP